MIEALRKRFVLISSVSVAVVFGLVFTVLFFVGTAQRDSTMDTLVDTVATYGVDPSVGAQATVPLLPDINLNQSAQTESVSEQLDGRFFSVWVGTSGTALGLNVGESSPVSTEQAWHLAQSALRNGPDRGWVDGYRYLVQHSPQGVLVIFVNGEATMDSTNQLLLVAAVVFLLSWALITALVAALSKRAIEPAIESFEKQRQFVTDANHELKTPLTLMLSNLDIIEAENGPSEWIDDTREEGRRMARLVSQLVALSRMDENSANLRNDPVELDVVVRDAVGEFAPLAEERGKRLVSQVDEGVGCSGDSEQLRRLAAILLDNAVKYCDDGGSIEVRLQSVRRHPQLSVENAYAEVDSVELERLFDRFYRSDAARTSSDSFGVGLSLAQSIARQHHGDIVAYKAGEGCIGFRVSLR